MTDAPDTPGWDAITAALRGVYGDQEPQHFGTVIKYALGGPDPIDGFSWFHASDPDHWHLVSYGMSELYEKESENPDVSGFGFEFTLRLRRGPQDTKPPVWPMNLMQNLARYVFKSGNVFAPGHHMALNGPMWLDGETQLVALLFAQDPELGEIETPFGRLQFVQLVGITQDELDATQVWNTSGLLGLMREENPRLVTDVARGSRLLDPAFQAKAAQATLREGSSCGATYVDELSVTSSGLFGKRWRVELGALGAESLLRILPARIHHGRPFTLHGPNASVTWEPGSGPPTLHKSQAVLPVTPATLEALLQTLKPVRGDYVVPGLGVSLKVHPTLVRDRDGNVLRTVG